MKPSKILAFMAVVMTAIAAAGYIIPDEGIGVGDTRIRMASLHSIVETRQATQDTPNTQESTVREDTPLPHPTTGDSVALYRNRVNNGPQRLWLPDAHYLDAFWHNVETARRTGRTIRILHYGDSQIEMDRMSSRLRIGMQRHFGGGGPGMIPFHTITPSLTVRQSTSGELVHLSSFGDSTVVRSRGDYGPMMQCFRMAEGTASTTLRGAQTKGVDERAKRFSTVTLLYNNRGSRFVATLSDRRNKTELPKLSTTERGIGSFTWKTDSTSDNIRLNVQGNADLYGVLVDNGPGVAVDNIPMRGCSGQQFTLIPAEKLGAAYSKMDVGLIILQFGGNSIPYLKNEKQISTYCQSIGRQIEHLHKCCPKAKILFIGPSDMSTRVAGKMQTYPMLPQLVDSLAATATAHGAAFWSIYHSMGGYGSMAEWSRQGLAGSDYIHFTQRGADMTGDRLWETLYNSYRLYIHEKKQARPLSTKPRRR